MYVVNANARYVIGIEFDIPGIRIDIFNLAYEHLGGKEYFMNLRSTRNSKEILEEMSRQASELMATCGVERDKVIGVGLAVTGFMSKKERISYMTPRIPEWRNVPIGSLLEEYLGIPVVKIEGQSGALALAEMEFGTTKNVDTFCYINFSHGVGAGLVLNGSIYDGPYGNAGLIGHMTVDRNGSRCICGNRGCLEVYASERVLREKLLSETKGLTLESILETARIGKSPQREVVEDAANYLGIAIANLVNIFEYQLVVLPKTFEAGGQWLLDLILQETCCHLQEILSNNLQIRVASVERRIAVSLGCAIPVWQQFYGVERLANQWLKQN